MIETLHLFRPLDDLLLDVLGSLSRDDWERPTIAGAWRVREVAAHLLDTALRRLAFVRDGWPPSEARITSDEDLIGLVNRLNAEGVRVYGRLSPRLLLDLLRLSGPQLEAYLATMPPDAPAAFAVSWAGERASAHWFDVAREYTERWHHQAQIRLALGESHLAPLMSARLHGPVLATFVRALPHACRAVPVAQDTVARIDVEGEGGGSWDLHRGPQGWWIDAAAAGAPTTRVRVPAALAWRLFTKGATAAEVNESCAWDGDQALAQAILRARAIVG